MKSKNRFGFLVLLLVATLFAPIANALPTSGALSGWEPNSVLFDYTWETRTLIGQIDWAVYETSLYEGAPQSGGQYTYAYQIFNSGSNVVVDSFSVGILEGAHVGTISYDDYQVIGGIAPAVQYFSPDGQSAQSAIYLFLPSSILPGSEGIIARDQHSDILLFTSNNPPTVGFGLLEGGSIATEVDLPTPIPEPATIALLGTGWLLTLTRKRRSA